MVKQGLQKSISKIQSIKNSWRPYLKNLALDIGAIEGTSAYVKFVVLGRSRVGSNLLLSLLNSHSRILALGEIFQDVSSIHLDLPNSLRSLMLLGPMRRDPVRFLSEGVFRTFPTHISAAGFKLFYYHAQDEHWNPIWTYLKSQPDIRVIHLKRQNILKTHLSRQRAIMTDQWVSTSGAKEKIPPVSLCYEECLDEFIRTREWEKQYDVFFERHPKLEILYENLANDYEGEMKRVQEFLGVNYEPVKPATYKQSAQPLSVTISNYTELKERFKGTCWEVFFED